MKKLRIFPSQLEIGNAQMPAVKEFKAIKLTYEQAMAFDHKIKNFDELIAYYGAANRLSIGEHYEGYIAVPYSWGVDIVHLSGYLKNIPPAEAVFYFDYGRAQIVREGRAWTVRYQDSQIGDCPGRFNYVWTFNGCRFAETITCLQKDNYLSSDINAEAMDKALKSKLINSLIGSHIVELTDEEDYLLKVYLGKNSYYRDFFTEVK